MTETAHDTGIGVAVGAQDEKFETRIFNRDKSMIYRLINAVEKRAKSGLTLEQMAREIGWVEPYLVDYCRGEKTVLSVEGQRPFKRRSSLVLAKFIYSEVLRNGQMTLNAATESITQQRQYDYQFFHTSPMMTSTASLATILLSTTEMREVSAEVLDQSALEYLQSPDGDITIVSFAVLIKIVGMRQSGVASLARLIEAYNATKRRIKEGHAAKRIRLPRGSRKTSSPAPKQEQSSTPVKTSESNKTQELIEQVYSTVDYTGLTPEEALVRLCGLAADMVGKTFGSSPFEKKVRRVLRPYIAAAWREDPAVCLEEIKNILLKELKGVHRG